MRQKLVVVLGIAGIALGIAALLGPWWSISSTATYTFQSTPQESHYEYGIFAWSDSSLLRQLQYSQLPRMAAVFSEAEILLVLGLLAGGGTVVVSGLLTPRVRSRVLRAGLGLVAVALTLASPLLLVVSLPPAYTGDHATAVFMRGVVQESFPTFWGSWSGSSSVMAASWSCGAGWGWYLAVAASFLFAAATTLLLWKSSSSVAEASSVDAP